MIRQGKRKIERLLFYKGIPDFHSLFLIIYVFYNIVGITNFSFYRYPIDIKIEFIFITGLLGFLFGMLFAKLIFDLKYMRYKSFIGYKYSLWLPSIRNKKKCKFLCYFWFLIVIIAAVYYNRKGIVVLNYDERFVLSAKLGFIALSYIVCVYNLYILYITFNLNKYIFYFIFTIYLLVLISFGYRAPIVNLILGLAFLYLFQFRIKKKNRISVYKFLGIIIILFLFLNLFEFFRCSLKGDIFKFFLNINLKELPKFLYIFIPFLSTARYDQEVLEKLLNYIEHNGFLGGKLFFANILTLLPGEQLGARNIIGSIVSSSITKEGTPWSITVVLQGNLYMDGGFLLVFYAFFCISFFMYYLKEKLARKFKLNLAVLYTFLTINFLKAIHTGYFDVSTIIVIFLFILFDFLLKVKVTKRNSFDGQMSKI